MATSPVPAASPKSALLSAQASLLQSLQKLTLQQNYVPARLPEGKVVGIVIILIASMAVIGFVLFKKKKNDTEE